MATPPLGPPSLLQAGECTTVVWGKRGAQIPACPSPQCVSWRATVTPLPSSLQMTSLVALPCME
eukprot:11274469-Prorocentrum_lima.AAC.1